MKNIFLLILILTTINANCNEIVIQGKKANSFLKGAEMLRFKNGKNTPSYIKFQKSFEPSIRELKSIIKTICKNKNTAITHKKTENDILGWQNSKYVVFLNNIPVEFSQFTAHTINGKIISISGNFPNLSDVENVEEIDYTKAKSIAEKHLGLKSESFDNFITEKVFITNKNGEAKLVVKCSVNSRKPLIKTDLYIDTRIEKVVFENSKIHFSNTTGTAVTRYSGTQTITTDSYNGSFRLRETSRGNGIETYNMNLGSDYGAATDFTDSDNYWNNTNAQKDEVAGDAHWATAKTYDYFFIKHGRNSIDGIGKKLVSYIHADLVALGLTSNSNAFWNGEYMTYGDGNQNPFTTVDICGHEVSHGLTTFTADLTYAEEPGALNEGYSDIFGACIEFYAKPQDANWTMGEDLGNPFRSMSDPASKGYPDTYLGQYWDFNQEVHHNSTVMSHWFYILSEGKFGTNDNGQSYNVTGISIDSAAKVAFRALVTYLSPSSEYDDARYFTIQAATDLFGACSPEVESVTNAWYAVGVGSQYINAVVSDFTADLTEFCASPATVRYRNFSSNGSQFLWNFGDGTQSNEVNPVHIYNTSGSFNVTLKTYGGTCGADTLSIENFISIGPAHPCIFTMPVTGNSTITNCTGRLFDDGGTENYSDNSDIYTVISPPGATSVTLEFSSFNYETGYDYLYIYDGPDTTGNLIGRYDGGSLPGGGIISSTSGSITLKQTSDQALTKAGFDLTFYCASPTSPPFANFTSDEVISCTGQIKFTDLSTNSPATWHWNFGDGSFSDLQSPEHTYTENGIYNVTLIASNIFGSDTIIRSNYIEIQKPQVPVSISDTVCSGTSASLYAESVGLTNWYSTSTGGYLHTGSNFITPQLTANTLFFAEDSIPSITRNVGNNNLTSGGSMFNGNAAHFLIFDCFKPVTLKSVLVNAQDGGQRNIQLMNRTGEVLQNISVNIPPGINRVELNIDLPADSGLRLGTTVYPNLFRSNSSTNYPYTIPGIISIKSSSASTSPLNYYYFFYDWEVVTPMCISNRVPVMAYVENCSSTEKIYARPEINANYNYNSQKIEVSIFHSGNEQTAAVELYNAEGKMLLRNKIDKGNIVIDAEFLKQGIYLLKVFSNRFAITKKIIKID